MNSFQTVGTVIARDRKGKSALLTVRFGKKKDLDPNERVQFVPIVRIRVPGPLFEKLTTNSPDLLEPGMIVSIQGYYQGVLHSDPTAGNSLLSEMVASNITDTGLEKDMDEIMSIVSSKGFGKYLDEAIREAKEGVVDVATPEDATN